jgi:hypothetical protein
MWFAGFIMSVLLLGCAGFDLEEPADLSGLSETQSDDEGEKNLAAIRAMMTKEHQRTSRTPESSDGPKVEGESIPWPPDWLSQYFSSRPLSDEESALRSESSAALAPSRSTRRTASGNITAKSPWIPKSSSRGTEADPWPHVPPYILSAPAGSAYPGAMRCVPDTIGIGGQRCQAK